jgi:hypothetical protein
MSKIINMESLELEVNKLLTERDDSHGFNHAKRVVKWTERCLPDFSDLSPDEQHDALVLAYLHDLNDPKYASEEMAKVQKILLSKYLCAISVDLALRIIKCASWSDERKRKSDWVTELGPTGTFLRHLLSNADKLDALGETGWQRCLLYSRVALKKRSSEGKIKKNDVVKAAIRHSYEKLLLLEKHIHGEKSRSLARQETRVLEQHLQAAENKQRMTTATGLTRFAGGLNIEGGRPALLLKPSQIWVNIVEVLDEPLVLDSEGLFSDIEERQKKGNLPVLEMAIPQINLGRTLVAYLMVIAYYHDLFPKEKICVHVHQFPGNAAWFINLFRKIFPNVTYLTDTPTFFTTKVDYSPFQVIISLSQCAGIGHCPGTLLYGEIFRPILEQSKGVANASKNESENVSKLGEEYRVNNAFVTDVKKIINSKWNSFAVNQVKAMDDEWEVNLLEESDFIKTTFLQSDGIWNPSPLDWVMF